jgi:hypothetical protein
MGGHAWSPKHRPVNTTEDLWCPFCPPDRRKLYICDPHHWGSAPYYENRLPKAQPLPPAQAKRKAA